ncbi:MAG: LacI family transcriptional regulator [Opitutaceae bacterium]|nr:LacI family transcriptional regulator [Opitutaceae bacterium]
MRPLSNKFNKSGGFDSSENFGSSGSSENSGKLGSSGKSATILEVARLAGVSPSTISNALNGKKNRMSGETLDRVMRAVRDLGYEPNRMARGLKTGFVSIIGLIVPSVENPFWGAFARCAEHAAMARNCQVMLCNGERDIDREQRYAESMLSLGIRGLILGSSPLSMKHLGGLARRGLKIVAFDRAGSDEDGLKIDSVRVDNRGGVAMAVGHLLRLGHKRIAFVAGPINSANRIDRLEAYRQTLRAHGITPTPAWEWLEMTSAGSKGEDSKIGLAGARHLLAQQDAPTGFVAINDMTAFGVLAGAREAGLHIPRDVSVVGFDDIHIGNMSNPPLTTIRQPLDALMQAAVSVLLDRMSGANTGAPTHVSLPAELIVRGSCGRAKE